MKEFPSQLNVENKENFSKMHYERAKCYMRREIYEHVIKCTEEQYFELDAFDKKYNDDMKVTSQMAEELMLELKELGWKCQTSYGGTGLFIYSTEDPPKNCYEDL